MNIQQMMKQAQQMQEKLQKQMAEMKVEATAGGGTVTVVLNGPDDARRERCLELLRKGQSKTGGWGPTVNSPPEVFDTAFVVIALRKHPKVLEAVALQALGRDYLIKSQSDDGTWPETTRPSGANSYAHRVSTTAWAVRALLP